MKSRIRRTVRPVLVVLLSLCLLTGCGRSVRETEDTAALTEGARTVFIEADGRRIAIEDPSGKTISDYLEEAGVTLNEGDVLTFDSDQDVTGDVTISVLRMAAVSVLVVSPEAPEGIRHSTVCYGGTVADAVRSVGIEPTPDMALSADPDDPVRDGMTIVITVRGADPETQEEPGEEDEASPETVPPSQGSSGSASPEPSEDGSSGSPDTGPSPAGDRYVVSVEVYEDCDGSGHGVKVYTYSDGSQEEVLY